MEKWQAKGEGVSVAGHGCFTTSDLAPGMQPGAPPAASPSSEHDLLTRPGVGPAQVKSSCGCLSTIGIQAAQYPCLIMISARRCSESAVALRAFIAAHSAMCISSACRHQQKGLNCRQQHLPVTGLQAYMSCKQLEGCPSRQLSKIVAWCVDT